jgi:hypothetical protein
MRPLERPLTDRRLTRCGRLTPSEQEGQTCRMDPSRGRIKLTEWLSVVFYANGDTMVTDVPWPGLESTWM